VQQSDGENNTIYDVDDNDLQIESIVHTNETKTIATSYQKQTLNINNDVKILMVRIGIDSSSFCCIVSITLISLNQSVENH